MKNISIVSLVHQYSYEVCKNIAQELDMNYIDYSQYLEYELENPEKAVELCGEEYIEKLQKKIVKRLCSFENGIISFPKNILLSNNCREILKKECLVIYLQLDKHMIEQHKDKVFEQLLVKEYDKLLSSLAHITIKVNKNTADLNKTIYKKIDSYFK